jgi:D-alanyl-D-alanine carboxypeptidase/D-alanyl-D-alanine-endopeptidase (penicillin-binding protein 4)
VWRIVGKPRAATVVIVVCVLILAAAVAVGGFFGGLALRSHPHARTVAEPSALPAASVAPSTSVLPSAPPVSPASLDAALAVGLGNPSLGSDVIGEVVDASTGTVLLDRSSTATAAPASTAKLATATAVLSVHAPTDRIRTTVVAGAEPGVAVLVGAGDPTLSAAPAGTPQLYKDAARISDLASALKADNITHIVVDDSLFSGPPVSPGWLPEDVPTEYAGAITAVMADGGRGTPSATVRSATPDVSAGVELAAQLGLPSTAVTVGTAPPAAAVLAQVDSAPYVELVRQMLQDSDNVIAEVLGRQVAIAEHQPVSFTGAAAAVRAALLALRVDIGAAMIDASGLAAGDRLSPASLTGVLRLVDDASHPALGQVADGLPVAGWSGTLADRYLSGASQAGAGDVRAKTGTLTGVSTLAGLVRTSSGRLLAFSFAADKVGRSVEDTNAAEQGLDDLAASMAACSCT